MRPLHPCFSGDRRHLLKSVPRSHEIADRPFAKRNESKSRSEFTQSRVTLTTRPDPTAWHSDSLVTAPVRQSLPFVPDALIALPRSFTLPCRV